MNVSAVDYLIILRAQIEQAHLISIRGLSASLVDEALSLIEPTETTPTAAAQAKAAIAGLRAAMAGDITGRSPTTESARQRAIQAVDMLVARVRAAPPSDRAINLHIP